MVRYVNRVEVVPARFLLYAGFDAAAGRVFHLSSLPWRPLCISGLAELEVAGEAGQGAREFTSKLSAVLARPFPFTEEPYSFRLRLTDGSRLVLGVGGRPFPAISTADKHPGRASERCCLSITVSLTGMLPPLKE